VIEELMRDHADITARARHILDELGRGRHHEADRLRADLIDVFDRHRVKEEAGLFCELHEAAEADQQMQLLRGEDELVRTELAVWTAVDDPDELRRALGDLMRHAELEDTDLFPFAMQFLPTNRWELVEQVHQHLLFT
jgi:hemerythrin-like domain-containing protein